jgi:uracil-DNA glycosylase
MGLRQGDADVCGRFPGARSRPFVAHCRRFFSAQLVAQRPSLILVLGAYALRFVARLSADLAPWRGRGGYARIDAVGKAVIPDVMFRDAPGLPRMTLVALSHPSCLPRDLARREYRDLKGGRAQVAMISDAIGSNG